MSKQKKSHKGLKIFGIIVLALVVIWGAIALWPRPQNYALEKNPMRTTRDLPILIAHGGGNKEFPDNTLEAFFNAYSVDPNVMMETDVSVTSDGVVILSHDTRIDRKTNETGNIIDLTYEELKKVDFGYTNDTDDDQKLKAGTPLKKFVNEAKVEVKPADAPYPDGKTPEDFGRSSEYFSVTTLEDLLVHFPNNRINVEIKQQGDAGMKCLDAVLKLLDKHQAYDRVVLASFHSELFNKYQELQADKKVPETFMCSPGTTNAAIFYILQLLEMDALYGGKTTVLQLPIDYDVKIGGQELNVILATQGLVDAAHEHNMAVHYWTINKEDEMRALIELGVDGIMTDYPHRLQKVYQEYLDAQNAE